MVNPNKRGTPLSDSSSIVKKEVKVDVEDVTFSTFARGVTKVGWTSTPKKIRKELPANIKPIVKKKKNFKKRATQSDKIPAIRRSQFLKLVKKITRNIGNEVMKWKKGGIDALQAASEDVMAEIFDKARYCAEQNGRTTVMLKDWRAAVYKKL